MIPIGKFIKDKKKYLFLLDLILIVCSIQKIRK